MQKILFTDIDGTIAHNGIIDQKVIKALEAWLANDNLLYISTGRGVNGYNIIREQIPNLKISGKVLQTGSLLMIDNEVMHQEHLKQNLIASVIGSLDEFEGLEFIFDTITTTYALNGERFAEIGIPVVSFDNTKELIEHATNAIQMCVVAFNDEQANQIASILNSKFSNEVSIYVNTHLVDIVVKGVSKSSGIKHFLKKHNLNKEQCIVIGDGGNDISMFKLIDNSYSFKYANDNVKQAAKHVVDDFVTMINIEL